MLKKQKIKTTFIFLTIPIIVFLLVLNQKLFLFNADTVYSQEVGVVDPVPDHVIKAGSKLEIIFTCSDCVIDSSAYTLNWIGHGEDLPEGMNAPTTQWPEKDAWGKPTAPSVGNIQWVPPVSYVDHVFNFRITRSTPSNETNDKIATSADFFVKVVSPETPNGKDVLVVVNGNNPDSIKMGQYYMKKRAVPAQNLVSVPTTMDEEVSPEHYETNIRQPIQTHLENNALTEKIRFIVTVYGIPSKILVKGSSCMQANTDFGNTLCSSVDSYLVDLLSPATSNQLLSTHGNGKISYNKSNNDSRFEQDKQNPTYLVTRLDAASMKMALGQLDRTLYSEKYTGPNSGNAYMANEPFTWGSDNGPTGQEKNLAGIALQCGVIENAGYTCVPDPCGLNDSGVPVSVSLETPTGPRIKPLWFGGPLNWYYDAWDTWRPGSVGFHLRSWSAVDNLRITDPNVSGGTWLKDSLAAGITGSAGAVYEPFYGGTPGPKVFFSYFLSGHAGLKHLNFAESMFLAMPSYNKKWKAIIVGDPIYTLPDVALNDSKTPKITNVTTSWNDDSLTVSWDTDISDSGQPEVSLGNINIGTTTNYEVGTEYDRTYLPDFAKSKGPYKDVYLGHHSVTKVGLDPQTKYHIKINAIDPENNFSSYEFTTDTPTGDVSIKNNPSIVTSSSVMLDLSTSIANNGQYAISNNGLNWTEWTNFNNSSEWDLNATQYGGQTDQEKKNVFVKYKNEHNSESPVYRAYTTLDNSVDNASLEINFGEANTSSSTVNLLSYAKDSVSRLKEMSFSNDNLSWSDWEDFDYIKEWDITDSEFGGNDNYGTKIVYVKIKDEAENTAERSAQINYFNSNPNSDTDNNNTSTDTNTDIITSPTITPEAGQPSLNTLSSSNFSTGWNMVSLPLTNGLLGRNLPDGYKIRKYNPTSNKYENLENTDLNLNPGTGYWIKVDTPEKIDGLKYNTKDTKTVEVPVSKGWALLGNPFYTELNLKNLQISYKNGKTRSFVDAVNRSEVYGFAWSWEASEKKYYFIAINPNKYKTSSPKRTFVSPFRGFWLLIKNDNIKSIIMNK